MKKIEWVGWGLYLTLAEKHMIYKNISIPIFQSKIKLYNLVLDSQINM